MSKNLSIVTIWLKFFVCHFYLGNETSFCYFYFISNYKTLNTLQVLTDTNYIVANHSNYCLFGLLKHMSSFESQLTKKLQFSKNNRFVHWLSTK